MDEQQFEQAARNEQLERDHAIAAARRGPREKPVRDGTGRRVCKDCADPMGAERLRALPDAVRCTHCQALQEKWGT